MGGGAAWDLTGLNRPHSGGGQLLWERFLCSQQLHLHGPKGGGGRGGSERGEDRDEKAPHTPGAESGAPPTIKGCYGPEMTAQRRKRWGLSAKRGPLWCSGSGADAGRSAPRRTAAQQ